MRDDLAGRLRSAFLGELEEQVGVMNADLLALERAPGDPERLKSLFRVAHTLKGAARAADVPLIEQACHALESLLAKARDGALQLGPDQFSVLYSAADALADGAARLRAGQDLAGSPLATVHLTVMGEAPPSGARIPSITPFRSGTAPEVEGRVRVEARKLDNLLTAVRQFLLAEREVETWLVELEGLYGLAARSAADWRRDKGRVRLALERSGATRGAAQALSTTEENLRRLLRETERLTATALRQGRALRAASDGLSRQVLQLRMRPFADACDALPRATRDLATASGKDVDLIITGGEVEADRAVVDGLREALLHLVRNAVDHGIEPPEQRARAGKPATGTVTVVAELRENRIVVTVHDDGMGLNLPAIRSQMERRGLPIPSEDRDIARALFQGGLSTRTEATPISGRGVGLELVRAAMDRVRGVVDVAWEEGRGTSLILECPPTLASIRALLVNVGPQTLAVPTMHIERLVRLTSQEIKRIEGRDVMATAAGPVPLVSLARLLPPLVERPLAGAVSVVLLRAGGRRLAVTVDDLAAEEEIVVQPLDGVTGRPAHLSGAALLGTGRVALLLDVGSLIAAGLSPGAGGVSIADATPGPPSRPRLLVVDDSITTRTLEQSILEAAGYDVLTAVDGADGWKFLQERGADLVVADVEMPRMDGFALCEAIRASKRFQEVPVVLVTALETPEHRSRGLEAGADAYIGKSSFDQQSLLDTVRQLLGEKA